MTLQLTLTDQTGAQTDATQVLGTVSLSGFLSACMRTLDFTILYAPMDANAPLVPCALGDVVDFYAEGVYMFRGVVFEIAGDALSQFRTITAYDFGFYLKNSSATYRFDAVTADEITRTVCTRFGIPIYDLAAPAVPITRKYNSMALVSIVDNAYTISSEATGEQYLTRFRGAALQVLARSMLPSAVAIAATDQQELTYNTSSDTVINHVAVLDADGNETGLALDQTSIDTYGMVHSEVTEEEGRDGLEQAQAVIDENGVLDRLTVTVFGNPNIMTGDTIQLTDPLSGVDGIFWVDADTHSWKSGQYTTKLTLACVAEMRESTSGAE